MAGASAEFKSLYLVGHTFLPEIRKASFYIVGAKSFFIKFFCQKFSQQSGGPIGFLQQ